MMSTPIDPVPARLLAVYLLLLLPQDAVNLTVAGKHYSLIGEWELILLLLLNCLILLLNCMLNEEIVRGGFGLLMVLMLLWVQRGG
jgi:hypothetical protein